MTKFLLHNSCLYKITNEKDKCFVLNRLEKHFYEAIAMPIQFQKSSHNNHLVVSKYKTNSKTKEVVFDKSQTNYVIMDKFNINTNYLFLDYVIDRYNTHVVNDNDVFQYRCYFEVKNILENITIVRNRLATIDETSVVSVLFENGDEHVMAESEVLQAIVIDYSNNMAIKSREIHDSNNPIELISFLETMLPALSETVFETDLVSESDIWDEDYENTSLDEEQVLKILELKSHFKTDGFRKSLRYTKAELNAAILITTICNKNEKSYLCGLELLFNKSRARTL